MTDLATGEIEIRGRMPWSSNRTFLVDVADADGAVPGIYKPHRGERPLWDFPDGLYRREVAAFLVSEALDWDLVPETLLRHDAPLGVGSLQRFVNADFDQHYFTLLEDEAHHPRLLQFAVFDLIINNADRKSGHCLIDDAGHLWGIDHGLSFHTEPKLRTVIWDFGGQPIPEPLRASAVALADALPTSLDEVLGGDEIKALRERARAVSQLPCLPDPDPNRRPYPWPLV